MKPVLIGIAGLSGSGKTALAERLCQKLEGTGAVIALDSYYHPQAHLSLEERAGLNYDHPNALDWALLEQHLKALARGEAVNEPQYLFDRHTRAGHTRRVEPRPYVILEGILALQRADVR